MFEPEVFREKMYRIKESTGDIVGTSKGAPQWFGNAPLAPISLGTPLVSRDRLLDIKSCVHEQDCIGSVPLIDKLAFWLTVEVFVLVTDCQTSKMIPTSPSLCAVLCPEAMTLTKVRFCCRPSCAQPISGITGSDWSNLRRRSLFY